MLNRKSIDCKVQSCTTTLLLIKPRGGDRQQSRGPNAFEQCRRSLLFCVPCLASRTKEKRDRDSWVKSSTTPNQPQTHINAIGWKRAYCAYQMLELALHICSPSELS